MKWFNNSRSIGIRISKYSILIEAQKLAIDLGITEFRASENWFQGFKKRNRLSFRKINNSSYKLLEIEINLICNFINELNDLKASFNIEEVYNYDETRFEWQSKCRYTYDFK